CYHTYLHSFPTRRSSDLKNADQVVSAYLMPYSFMQTHIYQVHFALQEFTTDEAVAPVRGGYVDQNGAWIRFHQHTWTSSEPWVRSEEHTSELQSPDHLVC